MGARYRREIMSAKKIQRTQHFHIPKDKLCYLDFLDLHEMWDQYIKELIKSKPQTTMTAIIMTCDLMGAIIAIVRSKCPTYIGVKGIVLQDTKNTFQILTIENKIVSIIKKTSVFRIDVAEWMIEISGKELDKKIIFKKHFY